MAEFMTFKNAVQKQINKMQKLLMFRTEIETDKLYTHYIESFPAGTNPIFREHTEHDCSCCKNFIRDMGNVIALDNGKVITIWDVKVPGFYQEVADAMADYVRGAKVWNVFKHYQQKVGTDFNHEQCMDGGSSIKWEHFYCELESQHVMGASDIDSHLGELKTTKQMLERMVTEIPVEAVEMVEELIHQGSLYRGEEHLANVQAAAQLIRNYKDVDASMADLWLWTTSLSRPGHSRMRNSVIGTLIVDIADGVDLERAVKSFEDKVAPANYQRPKALVTKKMIQQAQKKVEELGIMDALERRYAVPEDLTINNVIFADRSVKPAMGNAFEEMMMRTAEEPKKFDRVETIGIDKFINDVVPTADKIELLFENKQRNNLVSLVAPVHIEARNILKWGNNFSWSYVGEVTDSIKERVKAAGGNVDVDLRVSLSWHNGDDLDLHIIEPDGFEIYYADRRNHTTGGNLDVDMNAGSAKNSVDPVENICWPDRARMREGIYKIRVNNFTKRTTKNPGFEIQVEFGGEVYDFASLTSPNSGKTVEVVKLEYSRKDGLKVIGAESRSASQEHWGIHTNNFHEVSMLMHSPNHWDGEETGNKHWFFMLKDCKNPDSSRGFYNEFLRPELKSHRKVFEILSSQMKVEESDNQLSGLGFSSTKKTELTVRVTGQTQRVLKVQI